MVTSRKPPILVHVEPHLTYIEPWRPLCRGTRVRSLARSAVCCLSDLIDCSFQPFIVLLYFTVFNVNSSLLSQFCCNYHCLRLTDSSRLFVSNAQFRKLLSSSLLFILESELYSLLLNCTLLYCKFYSDLSMVDFSTVNMKFIPLNSIS